MASADPISGANGWEGQQAAGGQQPSQFGMQAPPPVPPAAAGTGGSSYVRLRGLPFTATDQEVAQWFAAAPGAPIQALRVLFTYNTTGRKSGEAYVELPEMMAERGARSRARVERAGRGGRDERGATWRPLLGCRRAEVGTGEPRGDRWRGEQHHQSKKDPQRGHEPSDCHGLLPHSASTAGIFLGAGPSTGRY